MNAIKPLDDFGGRPIVKGREDALSVTPTTDGRVFVRGGIIKILLDVEEAKTLAAMLLVAAARAESL